MMDFSSGEITSTSSKDSKHQWRSRFRAARRLVSQRVRPDVTFGIQELGNVQLAFGQVEGLLQIRFVVPLVDLFQVDLVGSERQSSH